MLGVVESRTWVLEPFPSAKGLLFSLYDWGIDVTIIVSWGIVSWSWAFGIGLIAGF